MEEVFFFTVFGAAVASALLFAAAYLRARRRLARLEDRLLDAGPDGELEGRVSELALRVAHLARGQEFLQQLLSGRRRLPEPGKSHEATPS